MYVRNCNFPIIHFIELVPCSLNIAQCVCAAVYINKYSISPLAFAAHLTPWHVTACANKRQNLAIIS